MKENGLKEFISRPEVSFWVPIIVTVVSIAISFTVLSARVQSLETYGSTPLRAELESHIKANDAQQLLDQQRYTEIQVKLAEIQKDILYIRESLTQK